MQTKSSGGESNKVEKGLLRGALVFLVSLLAILGSGVLFSPEFHRLNGKPALSEQEEGALAELGTLAAANDDVPIAAIILYGDSIVGRGYNTVVRDTNAAGHAEINAISDALARLGPRRFQQLNRDSLLIISTLEPCPMCRGAILEYRIPQVIFLKSRSFTHWFKQLGKQLKYEWNKEKGANEALQDSLLRKHPGYDSTRVEF